MAIVKRWRVVAFWVVWALIPHGAASAQVERAWTVVRQGPGITGVAPAALAIGAGGNVWIAAACRHYPDTRDHGVLVVQYDPSGTWVRGRTYTAPGNDCSPAAVAVGGGRVVVASRWDVASTDTDILVTSLDARGVLEWERVYDAGANGPDRPAAIALDREGNAIVVGTAAGTVLTTALVVLKYGPAGDLLWTRSRGDVERAASAVSVGPSGDIHVCGTGGTDETSGFVTIKYAADGTELWSRAHHGPGGGGEATALASHRDGSVVVTGSLSRGAGAGVGFATVKYGADGAELWARTYAGPGRSDAPAAIAIDLGGNVTVAGTSAISGTDTAISTVRYAPDGTELWARRADGPEPGPDGAVSVTVAADGSAVVTGRSEGSETGRDFVIVKYAPDGAELWVRRFGGRDADVPVGAGVDEAGATIVTGTTGSRMSTVKIDRDGVQVWARTDLGPEGPADSSVALALGPADDVVVTGSARVAGFGTAFSTVKYAPDGTQLWAAEYDGPRGSDTAVAVALDPTGAIHVAGSSPGPGSGADLATVKYGPDGRELWVRRYDGPGHGDDSPVGIALDPLGNVHVAGSSHGVPVTNLDAVTLKYAPDGAELWARRYDGDASGADSAKGIAVDGGSNVAIAVLSAGGPETGLDWATVVYAPDGTEQWARRFDAGGKDSPVAIAVDLAGNVIVTGSSLGSDTYLDFATVKYSPGGAELWTRRFDGPGHRADVPVALAVDEAGYIHVAGASYADGGNDCATLRYDPDGAEVWVRRYGRADTRLDTPTALALGAARDIFVAGESDWGLPWVLKYDPSGELRWARAWAQPVAGMVLGADGSIHVTGGDFVTSKYETLRFRRGLVDGDDRVNLVDAVALLGHLFLGGSEPECLDAADVDDSGSLSIADAIGLLRHLFTGGPPPAEPFVACGRDPTPDSADCVAARYCEPPWGATRVVFYGREFSADSIVFVVDTSGSMQDRGELLVAQREILRALAELPDGASVGIVFFADTAAAFPAGGAPARIDEGTRALATAFVQSQWGGSGSCCLAGLSEGLRVAQGAPSGKKVLLFLSDGRGTCQGADETSYLVQTLRAITAANQGAVEIHSFGVLEPSASGEDFLRTLARDNGGTYVRIER